MSAYRVMVVAALERVVSRLVFCVELRSTYRGGARAPTIVSAAAAATSVVVVLHPVKVSSTLRESLWA